MCNDEPRAGSDTLVRRIRDLCAPMLPRPTDIAARLSQLDGIRAVLFDVYGTLFVSGSGDIGVARAQSDARALEEALASSGFSGNLCEAGARGTTLMMQEIEAVHARRRREGIEYPEVDIREIWRNVLSALEADEVLHGAKDDDSVMRLAVEYECRVNPVWPMPDLAGTLSELKKKVLLLGIVSNAQFYTPLLFRAFLGGLPEETGFAPELCVWSYGAREAKPATRLFQCALGVLERRHSLEPHHILYVGNDRLNDIQPAAEAGCRTALFAGDKRSLRLRENDSR